MPLPPPSVPQKRSPATEAGPGVGLERRENKRKTLGTPSNSPAPGAPLLSSLPRKRGFLLGLCCGSWVLKKENRVSSGFSLPPSPLRLLTLHRFSGPPFVYRPEFLAVLSWAYSFLAGTRSLFIVFSLWHKDPLGLGLEFSLFRQEIQPAEVALSCRHGGAWSQHCSSSWVGGQARLLHVLGPMVPPVPRSGP